MTEQAGVGFSVNVEVLKDAGVGLSELLGMLEDLAIENIDCDGAFVGDASLAAAYDSFTTRWQIGIGNLTKDGRAIADGLTATAAAYLQADDYIARQLYDAGLPPK